MGHTREHADVFEMESIHVHSTVLPEVWAVAEAEQRTDQDPLTAVSVAPDVPCWLRLAYTSQDVSTPLSRARLRGDVAKGEELWAIMLSW